jgi:prophage regulatory protein
MRAIEPKLKRNLIRRAELRKRIPLSDATIWRYERDGKFPKRVVISESGNVAWYEDEIDDWVGDRVRAAGKRPAGVVPRKGAPAEDASAPAAPAAASASGKA